MLADIAFVVCGHSFESANGNRFLFNPDPTARRFTRSVASPSENSRKNIGFPIDHIGFGKFFGGNQPDILGNRCVGRTGVLAIHYFMVVFRIFGIGRLHGQNGFDVSFLFFPKKKIAS
jgi:hypothetical protein